ncbi:MAG: hypothetical protein ACJ782_18940 [Actinomycetota bacterium]
MDALTATIGTDGSRLRLEVRIRPEIRAAADKELPPDIEPPDLGLLPGDADEYVITSGALMGQRGFFTRDDRGTVVGVDLAGVGTMVSGLAGGGGPVPVIHPATGAG